MDHFHLRFLVSPSSIEGRLFLVYPRSSTFVQVVQSSLFSATPTSIRPSRSQIVASSSSTMTYRASTSAAEVDGPNTSSTAIRARLLPSSTSIAPASCIWSTTCVPCPSPMTWTTLKICRARRIRVIVSKIVMDAGGQEPGRTEPVLLQ